MSPSTLSAPNLGPVREAALAPAVVLVTASWDAAARYRCAHVREQLALRGVQAEVVSVFDAGVADRLGQCRVAIFHRAGFNRHIEGLYRRARGGGGLVVYDTDDLIFDAEARLEVPHGRYAADRVRTAWIREDAAAHRRAMEQADAVVVATDSLADEARRLGKRVWVHRNGFSLEMLRLTDKAGRKIPRGPRSAGRPERIVVGYTSGTPTHDGDFRIAKPALVRLLQTHEYVELWLVGPVDPGGGWGEARARIKRIGLVPWRRLPSVFAQFDVSIAPLESAKRFCRAKSEVKYIESGLAAVPVVASAGAGFDDAIRTGANGLLAASAREWADSLEMLVRDGDRRKRMGERAYADVLERYHPSARGRELACILDDMSRIVQGRALSAERSSFRSDSAARIGPASSRALGGDSAAPRLSSIRRGLYSMRYRGLRIFLMELWIGARGWWRGRLPG